MATFVEGTDTVCNKFFKGSFELEEFCKDPMSLVPLLEDVNQYLPNVRYIELAIKLSI